METDQEARAQETSNNDVPTEVLKDALREAINGKPIDEAFEEAQKQSTERPADPANSATPQTEKPASN